MKRMKRRRSIAAVLFVGCLLLAGCGRQGEIKGSGSEETSDGRFKRNVAQIQGLLQREENETAQAYLWAAEKKGSNPNISGQAASAQESSEPEAATVSLIMVGDILLHTPVEESARTEDGGYDYSAIFANVLEEIETADLALVNQEVIIGGEELGVSGYPAFNAPYEAGDALVEAGFDVICHATNHALDKGKRGLLNCLSFWQTNYPEEAVLGIYASEEERDSLYIYEQEGMRIAILNYTYGTNGIPLPDGMPYAVDLLEKERVVNDLQRAESEADFTIVCPHWGTEYYLGISAEQQKWTQIFLENGADLVLGTHPHVIEPMEWVEDEENGNRMLVYYSLGNFVNWTSGQGEGVANRMVGGMAQVTLGRDADGAVEIVEYGILPLVCHVESGQGGVTVYPLEEYEAELAERNEIVRQDPAFSLEYCLELCREVWGL